MSTTLVLQPDDYTAITFYPMLPSGLERGMLSDFEIVVSSLRFYEEQRVALDYANYQYREGGETGSESYPLVPLEFTCRVSSTTGATLALRTSDMLSKCGQLMRAIYNSSGYFKYKPDGLAAGVLDTYYRYLRSSPPAAAAGERSFWGVVAAGDSSASYIDGVPYRVFSVRLMTMPIATSNPSSPVSVLSATTLNNIGDGTNDYLTIANATVKGDMPALARIVAHPLTAGTSAAVGTLWIAKRTSGLASFVSTYLTSTANAPTGAWSTVTDASRCGGAYYRCTPAVSHVVYSRRYTISNWTSHQGRAAILAIVRNNGRENADFEFYYRWAISNIPLTGEDKSTSIVGYWHGVLLGEIDLPETEMSSQEDIDLYIDVCVVRKAGSGTFDLDAIKLLFTDEAAVQVDTPTGYGVANTQSILLENYGNEEIAHVVNHSTSKLNHICNLYGDMITLEPDVDTRLDVAWNRYNWGVFEDDFSGYGDLWGKLADMESDEDWSVTAPNALSSTYFSEGNQALRSESAAVSTLTLGQSIDLSDVSQDDYITLSVRVGNIASTSRSITLQLYTGETPDVNTYFEKVFTTGLTINGWRFLKAKKSEFTVNGQADWGVISSIRIMTSSTGGSHRIYIDDLRYSLVDPDDPTTFNETGEVWDFPTGTWHIEELDTTAKSLGQSDPEANVEKVALIHTNYGPDVRYRAKVRAFATTGKVGLVFRCSDGTGGSEDCYAFLVNVFSDQLELVSYAAGVVSGVAAAASKTLDQDDDYYLGVIVNSTSIQCFFNQTLDDLWSVANRVFNVTDSTHAAGQCGFMTITAQGRFADVKLEPANDLHVPSEQIQLSAWALFRTIYPFGES